MAEEINETTANLIEALTSLTSVFTEQKNALEEANDEGMAAEKKVAQELESLGLVIKTGSGAFSLHNEKLQQRAELEEEVNEKLRNNVDALKNASDAELEDYKNTQKRNKLYNDELASLGRVVKANGDIVKTTVELDSAQKKVIDGFKREDKLKQEQLQAGEQFKDMLRNLPAQLGIVGMTYAFDMLKAEVVGSYKAMIAMEDALLAGQEGLSVETAGTAAKMQEMAKATAKLGSSIGGIGDQFMMLGLAMTSVSWPLRLLSIAIGGILKLLGMQQEAQAAAMERDAEMEKKRGELNDKLGDSYKKLGSAGLAGADGMTGLFKNLGKLNLNINHLGEYTKVLNESQKNLAMIGGTAIEGVKKFTDVAGNLIYSGLGTIIRRMGIQNEEMMAHTANFMAQQARLGMKNTGDVSKATGEYILELDRLAMITGTTRKKQEESRDAMLKIGQLRSAILAAEGDPTKQAELKRALEQSSAMMAGGQTADAGHFAKLAATGYRPMDAEQARLLTSMSETIKMVREGQGSAESRFMTGVQEQMTRERQMAKVTQYTGDVKGVTTSTEGRASLMDLDIMTKAFKEKKPEGKDLAEYIKEETAKQREVTDQKQVKQEATEKSNRDAAFALQQQIMDKHYSAMERMVSGPAGTFLNAANKMLEASLNFLKSVGKSLYESGQDARKKWDAWDPFGRNPPAANSGGKGPKYSGGQSSSNMSSSDTHQNVPSTPPKLAKVSSITGKSASVNADLAPNFQGLISYLDKNKYPITDLGGYNDRDVRGKSGVKSYHAAGAALDINSGTNPMSTTTLKTDMPDNISQVASGYGLGWGGDWQSRKDPMHFSAGTKEGGTLMAKTGGVFDGPPGGYPVELHGREAVVPLPNPSDKIAVDKSKKEESVTKNTLSNVMTSHSPNDKLAPMIMDMINMMENKLDDMIRQLEQGNKYSDKLVKAMA